VLLKLLSKRPGRTDKQERYDSVAAYQRHLDSKLKLYPNNRDLAFADAIGSDTIELFERHGDGQVAVLMSHGLHDGMSVYDLGCGCGRTAQALQRGGWSGRYMGADIIEDFVRELKRKCPDFDAVVNTSATIVAEDSSLDMVFHWSVFTHVSPEECFLYLQDTFRALKPGGKLVFSFLELADPEHYAIFEKRLEYYREGRTPPILDAFLHRDWIGIWARKIGFGEPAFTDGQDDERHPLAWQTVAALEKPAAGAS